ncbi:MAG: LysR family transcriptional regulator, partial [Methanobrevibacter sp.]|nr:LysR family transcriptional regulator [Candidatus Methanovirga australis]
MKDFYKFYYFVCYVDNKLHLRNTANYLHVAHTAIHKAIKDLEDNYLIKLLQRKHNKITLTKLGEKIYQEFKPISHSYKIFMENNLINNQNNNYITITFNPIIQSFIGSKIISYLLKEKKQYKFKIINFNNNYELIDALKNNIISYAFLNTSCNFNNIKSILLFSSTYSIIYNKNNSLNIKSLTNLNILKNSIIRFNKININNDPIREHFNNIDNKFKYQHSSDNLIYILNLIEDNYNLVTILPTIIVKNIFQNYNNNNLEVLQLNNNF